MPITPANAPLTRDQRLDRAADATLVAWAQANRATADAKTLATKWLELRTELDAVLP